jgi:hypothetical protein
MLSKQQRLAHKFRLIAQSAFSAICCWQRQSNKIFNKNSKS